MERFNEWHREWTISSNLDEQYLYEERHVYRQCEDAIEELFDTLYKRFKNNETGFFKTGLYYEPYTRDCNVYEQGYPIYVECIDDKNYSDIKMTVQDYNENPEEILLVVNFYPFRELWKKYVDSMNRIYPDESKRKKMLITKENDFKECIFKASLKHEFGHIRQNYSIHTGKQRLVDNRKFVSDNIDTTLFDFVNPSQYHQVMRFMYLFSPVEQQQRLAELYEYVNNMTESEIYGDTTGKEHFDRYEDVNRVIVQTDLVHLIGTMKECFNDLGMWGCNPAGSKITVLIAFYFKYYNLYKTRETINREFVEKVFKNKADADDVDFCHENFLYWLNDQILEYTKKVYTVVHYNLYKRFTEWTDVKKYGVDFGERISEGLIEQLNEQYGDERIPLLNKPIDY